MSKRLESKLGSFTDVAIIAISTLAIEGLINEFFLGFISRRYLFISLYNFMFFDEKRGVLVFQKIFAK